MQFKRFPEGKADGKEGNLLGFALPRSSSSAEGGFEAESGGGSGWLMPWPDFVNGRHVKSGDRFSEGLAPSEA